MALPTPSSASEVLTEALAKLKHVEEMVAPPQMQRKKRPVLQRRPSVKSHQIGSKPLPRPLGIEALAPAWGGIQDRSPYPGPWGSKP